MHTLISILTLLLPLSLALPAPQTGTVSCGKDKYTAAQIMAAQNAACKLVRSGGTAGSSTYPHTYRDDEGFTFAGVDGPYFEFPILTSGKVYSGGSPGPDRVIINDQCELAGEITHLGAASTNGFVGCSGTS